MMAFGRGPTLKKRLMVTLCCLFVLAVNSIRADEVKTGPDCSARTLQGLARVYMARGEYGKAETLVAKALDVARTDDTTDEQESACLIDLAWVYKNQGRFTEAEQSCQLGLQMQERLYYPEHPYIAYTLRILGSIYQSRGKFTEAHMAFDRAIEIIRKCHQPDDPVPASFEVDIARLLMAEGRLEQAETVYERALLLISDYYGPEHLYTANILRDVAKMYYLQGRYDQAGQLLSWVTAVQQEVYGRESGLLVANWLTMARIYQAREDLPQAERLLVRAFEAAEARSGRKHPLMGELLAARADLYLEMGRYEDAQAACLEAIEVLEQSNRQDSEPAVMATNCLAQLRIIQGKFTEGYDLACDALTTAENIFGPEHSSAAIAGRTVVLAQELETVARLAAIRGDNRRLDKDSLAVASN